MRVQVEKVEQDLREKEKVWKVTNEDLLRRVELLRKEKAEKEEEPDAEIVEVIAEVKASTIMVVWESNIKLVEDVANRRFWNPVGWRATPT